jgi:transcriptional regulator with XRE-family HTH domain
MTDTDQTKRMNTETEKKGIPKATGRRYKSVGGLMKKEGLGIEVERAYSEIKATTMITERLAILRQAAGITQEDMAKQLGMTQSAVSKIEAGRDEDLTIRLISEYSRITGQRIGLFFGKPMNHVEAVKAHALAIRQRLSALAALAHKDEQLESHIQGFFGEAFFNILAILEKCQKQMPGNEDFEIKIQALETNPEKKPTKKSSSLVAA